MRSTVSQRLFLGLTPSLLAVALVVGLAYYGEYGRQAPGAIVGVAAALSLISLGATWMNARHLAGRIARLAGTSEHGGDEIDRIARTVDQLGISLASSEAERVRATETADAAAHDRAAMLAGAVASTIAQLDEVRLPLHILLDARFGELNENQEELLGAARTASDGIDDVLRRLAQIADADRGALTLHHESVQLNDVVRAVLPLATAAAARRDAHVESTLDPMLPRVPADRARLAEALALLVSLGVADMSAGTTLAVATGRDAKDVWLSLSPASIDCGSAVDAMLVRRLLDVQGARIVETADGVTVRFALRAAA